MYYTYRCSINIIKFKITYNGTLLSVHSKNSSSARYFSSCIVLYSTRNYVYDTHKYIYKKVPILYINIINVLLGINIL